MSIILVAEGPGVVVSRSITHHAFFFGHYDADLDEREIPPAEHFDPDTLTWPDTAILLRVMHRITRVRTIWGESFPGEVEAIKSRRVFPSPGCVIVREHAALKPYLRQLRDADGAERLVRLGNIEGLVVEPERRIWAKLRQGESVATPPGARG